jgi:hypothetical protein
LRSYTVAFGTGKKRSRLDTFVRMKRWVPISLLKRADDKKQEIAAWARGLIGSRKHGAKSMHSVFQVKVLSPTGWDM